MNHKLTIFIAVIPQDYQSANVELFESREEAQQFIDDCADRNKSNATIMEREVLFPSPSRK